MATLGSTSQPGPSTQMYGLNVTNQFATALTLPAGGPWKITAIGCWLAGYGASSLYSLCLWDNSMNLDRQGPVTSIAAQTMGSYNATSATANISDIEVSGGATVWVGFWRHSDDPTWFPHTGSGSRRQKTTGDAATSMSGYGTATGNLGVWLTYVAANNLPTAPTLKSPASGTVLAGPDMTPTVEFVHNDADGDDIDQYDLQVDNNSGFGSVNWEATGSTSSIQSDGKTVIRSLSAGNWGSGQPVRGVDYYWRARTRDAAGYGPWSGSRTFRINALPVATKVTPPAGAAAELWNLGSDLTAWTDGGAHAKPHFDWTFADEEGGQSKYRVRIYDAASGGTLLYDSGEVSSATTAHDAGWAGVRNQTYYWTLDVKDKFEWQGESSRTAFTIKWAQAIYQHSTGLGSSSWGFTAGAVANGAVAFLFATATGADGAGRSAWKASVGALAITPTVTHVNVLVRLRPISTAVATVSPTLPLMTFTYLATAVLPDRWVLA